MPANRWISIRIEPVDPVGEFYNLPASLLSRETALDRPPLRSIPLHDPLSATI